MRRAILLIGFIYCGSVFSFDGGQYFSKNCSSCHTIGDGDKIGPDLAEVSKRRSVDWIVKFVRYPVGMMEGDTEEPGYENADPVAKKLYEAYKPMIMTEFELDRVKIEAIIKYIDAQKKSPKGKILNFK